jgi:hypothetical protein
MTAEEAVKGNFLFLNFRGDSIKDTRTPLRFTAVAEKAAALDLKSDRVRAFVRLLKEHCTVLDPTPTPSRRCSRRAMDRSIRPTPSSPAACRPRSGAARVMKLDGDLGSIEAGKPADVILVDGNPTERLGDLRRVSFVVKDGAVYDPEAILKSSGIRPINPGEELKAP